jgi:hypothetical protein
MAGNYVAGLGWILRNNGSECAGQFFPVELPSRLLLKICKLSESLGFRLEVREVAGILALISAPRTTFPALQFLSFMSTFWTGAGFEFSASVVHG